MAEALSSCVVYLSELKDPEAYKLLLRAQFALKDAGHPCSVEECHFVVDCVKAEHIAELTYRLMHLVNAPTQMIVNRSKA